uniref:AraC family transcriptional regulator n=1 Tax=Cupriavidus yeoncheonensis TaxID=1462994 RepID=UPI003F49336E
MAIESPLDLSKIYRSPVFQTRSARDAQYELSRQIIDHGLRWHRGQIFTSLHRRELQQISLMILQYGVEVEVTPLAFNDFALVQMPLKGSVQVECDGRIVQVGVGEALVVPPRRMVRLLWEPGCEQLIMRLPDSLLIAAENDQHESAHTEHTDRATAWVDPAYKMRPELIAQWYALLQQTMGLLPAAGENFLHRDWLAQFERMVAGFIYAHQPSSGHAGSSGQGLASGSRPGQCPQLDRVESYIRSRLFAPLSLVDLARAAGVTTRTLNVLCHRHRGVAPMTLVRNIRLDAAHQRLLSGAPTSVTDVALEYGFGHLGRFSSYYRERFGELPKQTGRTLKEAQCSE